MEHRVLAIALHGLGFVALCVGTAVFFTGSHSTLADLFSFVPAGFSFALGIIVGMLRPEYFGWMSLFDPFTIFVSFIAAILVLFAVGFRVTGDKSGSDDILGWALYFTTFAGGLEAGRGIEKRARERKRQRSEYDQGKDGVGGDLGAKSDGDLVN
ncbi:MAG: hypothetical protein R3C08_14525 [Hyphomonas sp.]